MEIKVFDDKVSASKAAAALATDLIKSAIKEKGRAVFVIATGASQFDFLKSLVEESSIDWAKTVMFHLDEYVGLPETHPASFRKYLKERFVEKVHPGAVNFIQGDAANPEEECNSLGELISKEDVDVAFVGIGENGHLAFNDPPADFETEKPYIVVELAEACRKQQLGEGWFPSLEKVPKKAISMAIKQIMKSKAIVCTIPNKRKAQAVKDCFENEEVSNMHPSSILKRHQNATIFLDKGSASLLKRDK